jgi:RimJ/RimL family protein N-acetyltransferase
LNDRDLLYEWANEPAVRKNSFSSETISYETHVEWFHKMLKDENIVQYILMENDYPIGQIRVQIYGEEAEVGYSISAENRGRGYGGTILKLLSDKISMEFPCIRYLIAKVKPENEVSSALFLKEGYDMNYLCYKKQIGEKANMGGVLKAGEFYATSLNTERMVA